MNEIVKFRNGSIGRRVHKGQYKILHNINVKAYQNKYIEGKILTLTKNNSTNPLKHTGGAHGPDWDIVEIIANKRGFTEGDVVQYKKRHVKIVAIAPKTCPKLIFYYWDFEIGCVIEHPSFYNTHFGPNQQWVCISELTKIKEIKNENTKV